MTTRAEEFHRRANILRSLAFLIETIETADLPCRQNNLPCEDCPAQMPDGECFIASLQRQTETFCKGLPAGRPGPGPDRKRPAPIIVAEEAKR